VESAEFGGVRFQSLISMSWRRLSLLFLSLVGCVGCAHKHKVAPDPAWFKERSGDQSQIESRLAKKWPAVTRYVFTEKDARAWKQLIRNTECQKLILAYNGKDSGLSGYRNLDTTAIVGNGDFGNRLLESSRSHQIRDLTITTFDTQLIAIMLDKQDEVIAALTENDGCFQPLRVGRYRGKWVFDSLFWKRAHSLRFFDKEMAREMRCIARENGPDEWSDDL
jgi:hypothetical protein